MYKSGFSWLMVVAILFSVSTSTQAQFTENTTPIAGGLNFIQLGDGGAAWGDYDADGDLDLVLTGRDNSFVAHLFIYQNNGDGTFSVADADTIPGTFLLGLDGGGVTWGDYDSDGDLDLVQNGFDDDINSPQRRTYVYKNNNGIFSPLLNPVDGTDSFIGSDDFDPNWVDVDLDGDLDLYYADSGSGEIEKGVLYINNGNDTFTRNLTPVDGISNFEGYREGSSVWGDIDRDGDLDLFALGASGFQGINSSIYTNNGDGTFSLLKRGQDAGTFFSGARIGATQLVDYDDDGLLDLFYTGEAPGNSRRGDLYRNNGDDSFAFVTNIQRGFRGFTGVLGFGASWGDYDGDGDSDLIYGGFASTSRIVELWSNQGLNDFDKIFNPVDGSANFEGVSTREVLFGDYDGDGDLDVLVSGTRSDFGGHVKLYENTSNHSNQAPSAPSGLSAKRTPTGVEFSWNSAVDDATPLHGLSYEIRIGTTAGASDILGANSIIGGVNNGSRLIPYRGTFQDTTLVLNLPDSTYFWSVQAVDAGLQGSVFATEMMSEIASLVPTKPNPFSLISPVDGIDTLTKTPTLFVWEKATDDLDESDSLEYQFDLSSDSQFSSIIESATLQGDTTFSISANLNPGDYFWRVSVTNSSDSTTWGSNSDQTPYQFTITEVTVPTKPNPFKLLTPANGLDTLTKTPALFVWEKAIDDNDDSDSLNYMFELSSDSLFSATIESASIKGDTSYSVSAVLNAGQYFWRVSVTNSSDSTTWGSNSDQTPFKFTITQTTDSEIESNIPNQFLLEQNYPNPFNPNTSIKYQLPVEGIVRLTIYDVTGRVVALLVDEHQSAGLKTVQFDASNLSSGVYLYTLESGSFLQTRKMLLIK